MKLYDNDERTYGSVFSPDVKRQVKDILDEFNLEIGSYEGVGRREFRRSLEIELDWNYAYTHDQSTIDTNVYMKDDLIEFISKLVEDYGTGRIPKSKSYHKYERLIACYNNSPFRNHTLIICPYYSKKLKLKIGMVRY